MVSLKIQSLKLWWLWLPAAHSPQPVEGADQASSSANALSCNSLKSSILRTGLNLSWLRAHSVRTALSSGGFMKTMGTNCPTSQLPQCYQLGITRGWPQNLKEKYGVWDVHGELWKTPLYSGNAEGRAHIRESPACPGRLEKTQSHASTAEQ